MSDLDELRKAYPQYNDWSDRELADAVKDTYYADMDDQEYYSHLGMDSNPGWAGVGGDIVQGVKDLQHLPAGIKHIAQQANPQLEGLEKMSGTRALQNLAAGLGEMGRGLLNLPSNVVNYGKKKEILPDWVQAWRPSEQIQNFDYKQGAGLGEEQPGDALIQAIPELVGYGGAGELGAINKATKLGKIARTGVRGASYGTQAVAHNQNPVTAIAAIPATELGLKAAGKGLGLAGKAVSGPTKAGYEMLSKHLGGNKNLIGRDIMSDILPSEIPQAHEAVEAGQRLGVTLTPGEAAGSPLLAKTEGAMGTTPQGQRDYVQFKKGQKVAQENAVNTLLDDVSKVDSVAGEDVRSAAQSAIEKDRQAMLAKAQPFYTAAESEVVNPNTLNTILKDSNVAKAWEEVLKDPLYASEIEGFKPNTVKVLDLTKRRLDSQIAQKLNFGDNDAVRILTNAKNKLVTQLDKVSPNYAKGRSLYAGDAEVLEKLQGSNLGKIANMSDRNLKNVSKTLFDPSQTDIKVLEQMRDRIVAENPDAWQRIVRNEMERRLDTKNVNKTSNSGSNFYDKIVSNDRDFNQFMTALDGNPVAQQKLTDMRLAFKNLINSYTVKTAAGQAKSSLDVPRSTMQFVKNQLGKLVGGKYDKAAVEIITSPDWNINHIPNVGKNGSNANAFFKALSGVVKETSKKAAPQAIVNEKESK